MSAFDALACVLKRELRRGMLLGMKRVVFVVRWKVDESAVMGRRTVVGATAVRFRLRMRIEREGKRM